MKLIPGPIERCKKFLIFLHKTAVFNAFVNFYAKTVNQLKVAVGTGIALELHLIRTSSPEEYRPAYIHEKDSVVLCVLFFAE